MLPQTVVIVEQSVPELTKQQIKQIKSAALAQHRWISARYNTIRSAACNMTASTTRFQHPGGFAGAAELACMQVREAGGVNKLGRRACTLAQVGSGSCVVHTS